MSARALDASEAPAPFEAEGFRGLCPPTARTILEAVLAQGIQGHAESGRVLRRAMSRVTSRVTWPGVGGVLLKVHRMRSLGERVRARACGTRAQAEWKAACFLTAAGVPVPAPLAVGVEHRGGLPAASFYAARFLEGALALDEALPRLALPARVAVLERVARTVGAMHASGFDHRDLHAGNVLVLAASGEGVVLTDLHRHRLGPVGRAARQAALADLVHSLRPLLAPPEERALLGAYLGTSVGDAARWGVAIERLVARRERRRRASRSKRCLKESTVYTRDVGAGWGARRRDLSPERLERALAAHDRARREGGPALLKRGRRSIVTRVEGLVVKERLAPGPWSALRDRILARRHAAGYRNAHRLGVLGVDTARPLAFVRRGSRCWTLLEDLGALERLDLRAGRLYADGSRAAQVALREASAAWLGALHRQGVYHGDLKGVNVLVADGPDGPRFHLIDTDRCRFAVGAVDARRRAKNLAQLAASIPRRVTRSERLRWYRRYRAALGVSEDARTLARAVARVLAPRTAVVDDPIE